MLINRDKFRDALRDAVLEALDTAVRDAFGDLPTYGAAAGGGIGATDGELPLLFKGLDRHAEIVAERYGVVLVDYDPAEVAKANPLPGRI